MMKNNMATFNKTYYTKLVNAPEEVFNNRIISRGLWSPRLVDLSVCDFYLSRNLKGNVYRNTSHTVEALQNKIRNMVALISTDELWCV